ncbi:hypothetical protein OZX65_06700 [Leuconostocaceae bacterium ESL0723]|nr:hypothetical protein OZX65_06700 [Leuconostocaceae bacterium ESL0723]
MKMKSRLQNIKQQPKEFWSLYVAGVIIPLILIPALQAIHPHSAAGTIAVALGVLALTIVEFVLLFQVLRHLYLSRKAKNSNK